MADSPTAKHRTRLIREMSRELKRPSRSESNQDVSQGSSFWNDGNEACASPSYADTTDSTNTTQRLPTLRDSAKKYRTYTRPAEPDFEINTSMMAKAFPDFSQGAIITEDGGSSLELGRSGNRASTPASNTGGDYEVDLEQYRRRISASKRTARAGSEDLRKEAIVRRATDSPKPKDASFMSASKVEDHGSDGSRNSSGRYRQPLAETQARVRVDDDASQLSENKSETLTLNVRRTRFAGRRNQPVYIASDGSTDEFNTDQAYREATRDASTLEHVESTATRTTSGNTSNQAVPRVLLFPDTRDLSGVLSESQQDGKRVRSHQRKSRVPRFASSTDSRDASDIERVHTPVEDIPTQTDEDAIIEALNFLHDRVTDLECDRDVVRHTMAELKADNVILRADMVARDKRRLSNGTTGTANGESLLQPSPTKDLHLTSITGLVQSLQGRVDAVETKATAAEATVEALTRERDAANHQLNLIAETGEELLDRIQLVEEQRDDFKRKLIALQERYDQESQQWKAEQAAKKSIQIDSCSTAKRINKLDLFDNSFRFVSSASGPVRSTSDIRHSEAIRKALETPEEEYDSEANNSTVLHHVIEKDNILPQEVDIGQMEDKEPEAIQSTGLPQDFTRVSSPDVSFRVPINSSHQLTLRTDERPRRAA